MTSQLPYVTPISVGIVLCQNNFVSEQNGAGIVLCQNKMVPEWFCVRTKMSQNCCVRIIFVSEPKGVRIVLCQNHFMSEQH